MKDAKIFNVEEVHQFYFDRDMVRDTWFFMRHDYGKLENEKALYDFLRDKGFSHILVTPKVAEQAALDPAGRFALLQRLLQNPQMAKPLVRLESRNIRESQVVYEVYALSEARPGFKPTPLK